MLFTPCRSDIHAIHKRQNKHIFTPRNQNFCDLCKIIFASSRYYKVKYRRIVTILTIALMLTSIDVSAQYDVSFAHYFDMQTSFNPAAAGKEPKLNVTGCYAMDLAGYEHNPQTAYISADMPFQALGTQHGVGLILMNDKLGLFDHKRLQGQYAYRHKMAGGWIAIGVQAGLLSENFRGSDLDLENSTDDAFSSADITGNGLDLSAGVYYSRKNWYVGASAQHVNSPLITLGETNELQVDATLYLTGGCSFKLRNPFLTVATSALVRSDLTGYRGDVTARLIYRHDGKMMYGGAGYSPTNSATVYIGGSFHGIVVGYSYEMYTNGIGVGNGSHEVFVGYQTDINLIPKGKNRHQSVRYL